MAMRDQLAALIRLKLTLFRHTLNRKRALSLSIFVLFLLIILAIAVGIGIALFLFGMKADGDPSWQLLLAFDVLVGAFLFLWLFGVFAELQRSEIIDFHKMLYLPVSLRMVFLFNYAASLLTPAGVFYVFAVSGLCLGLTLSQGPRMLLGMPLAVAFYLMLGAWIYCFRGILVVLMENRRRRRVLLALLPLTCVLMLQIPNILHLAKSREETAIVAWHETEPRPQTLAIDKHAEKESSFVGTAQFRQGVALANCVIPLGWFPYGVSALANGKTAQAVLGFAGLSLLAGLGLSLSHRSTLRYYTGDGNRGRERLRKRESKTEQARRKPGLAGLALPFVDDDTSAVAAFGILALMRQPKVRAALILTVAFGVMFLVYQMNLAHGETPQVLRNLAPLGLIMLPMLGVGHFAFNCFGIDAQGFRVFVLMPAKRYKFLAGKNLALSAVVVGLGCPLLIAGYFLLGLSLATFAIALLQVLQVCLLFSIVGNLASIYFPYRLFGDGMRSAPRRPIATLVGLGNVILVVLLTLPSALCLALDCLIRPVPDDRWMSPGMVLSIVLLTATLATYALSLRPIGRLLFRREQKVLEALARDTE